VIRRSHCDIACLQEVEVNGEKRKLRHWSEKHADNQPEMLASATGLASISFSGPLCAYVGEYKRSMCEDPFDEVLVRDKEATSGFGNAVLSKYPILETQSLVFDCDAPLSEDYIYMAREQQPRGARAVLVDLNSDPESWQPDGKGETVEVHEKKGPCCAGPAKKAEDEPVVKKNRKLIWVVCTQLSHRSSSAEQRDEAEELMTWVDSLVAGHEGPEKLGVVICGDLNAAPFAPCSSYSKLAAGKGWLDTWKSAGTWCKQATYPSCCAPACGVRLDHVFVLDRPGLAKVECTSTRVLGDAYEDRVAAERCGIVVELKIHEEED